MFTLNFLLIIFIAIGATTSVSLAFSGIHIHCSSTAGAASAAFNFAN
jgi:hypothetical protein